MKPLLVACRLIVSERDINNSDSYSKFVNSSDSRISSRQCRPGSFRAAANLVRAIYIYVSGESSLFLFDSFLHLLCTFTVHR